MRVHDFHQSGRHDATPHQWKAAVKSATARADVGAFTEAKDRPPVPPSWEAWSGGNECAVFWDRGLWRDEAHLPIVLTTKSWHLGDRVRTNHERHGVVMTCVLLRHKMSRHTLLRGVFHAPSSVQSGAGWSRKVADRDNVAAARDVLKNLGPQIIKAQDLMRPDHTTISADWNVHLGLAAWRNRLEDALVGTELQLHLPAGATHRGGRKIDAHASTLPLARDGDGDPSPVRLLPKLDGFDHRGAVAAMATK